MEFQAQTDAYPTATVVTDPPATRHVYAVPVEAIRRVGATTVHTVRHSAHLGVGVGCAWIFVIVFFAITMRSVFGKRSSTVYDNCGSAQDWANTGVPVAGAAFDALVASYALAGSVTAQLLFFAGTGAPTVAPVPPAVAVLATATIGPVVTFTDSIRDGSLQCSYATVSDAWWTIQMQVPASLPQWTSAMFLMLNVSFTDSKTNVTQTVQVHAPLHAVLAASELFSGGCRLVNMTTTPPSAAVTLEAVDANTCDYPLTVSADTFRAPPPGGNVNLTMTLRPVQGAYETIQTMFQGDGISIGGNDLGSDSAYSGTSVFIGFLATTACVVGACALTNMYMTQKRLGWRRPGNADQYTTIRADTDQEMNQQYY